MALEGKPNTKKYVGIALLVVAIVAGMAIGAYALWEHYKGEKASSDNQEDKTRGLAGTKGGTETVTQGTIPTPPPTPEFKTVVLDEEPSKTIVEEAAPPQPPPEISQGKKLVQSGQLKGLVDAVVENLQKVLDHTRKELGEILGNDRVDAVVERVNKSMTEGLEDEQFRTGMDAIFSEYIQDSTVQAEGQTGPTVTRASFVQRQALKNLIPEYLSAKEMHSNFAKLDDMALFNMVSQRNNLAGISAFHALQKSTKELFRKLLDYIYNKKTKRRWFNNAWFVKNKLYVLNPSARVFNNHKEKTDYYGRIEDLFKHIDEIQFEKPAEKKDYRDAEMDKLRHQAEVEAEIEQLWVLVFNSQVSLVDATIEVYKNRSFIDINLKK